MGELWGSVGAARPSHGSKASLSRSLPSASVQRADIDPAQPSFILAACSPFPGGPTKKGWLTYRASPRGILHQNNARGTRVRAANSLPPVPARSHSAGPGTLRLGEGSGDPQPRLLQGAQGQRKKIFAELMKLKFRSGREGDSQSEGRYLHRLSDWLSRCLFRMLL